MSTVIHAQDKDSVFNGHTWQPPYYLPIPEKWGVERFQLPPSFAPAITHKGVEDIRFTPGWAKNSTGEYWSYAFLWYLDDSPAWSTDLVEKYLTAYYTGLINVNSDSSQLASEKPFTVTATFTATKLKVKAAPSYTGKIEMIDYMTRKPIVLFCKLYTRTCEETGKAFAFFELSPKTSKHPVWKSLDKLWTEFRCSLNGGK